MQSRYGQQVRSQKSDTGNAVMGFDDYVVVVIFAQSKNNFSMDSVLHTGLYSIINISLYILDRLHFYFYEEYVYSCHVTFCGTGIDECFCLRCNSKPAGRFCYCQRRGNRALSSSHDSCCCSRRLLLYSTLLFCSVSCIITAVVPIGPWMLILH